MEYPFGDLKDEDSIRLIILQPATTFDAELRASLICRSLEDKPDYEAISYVWGEPVFSHEIHLPDGTINITENMSISLRRFRLPNSERILWVDQLCINQRNLQEKSQQVGVMSKIFKGAAKVLIWLGEETPQTKPAITFLEQVAESHGHRMVHNDIDAYWWRGPPVLEEAPDDIYEMLDKAKEFHIEDIYSREWFSRLWVVQEAALARKASLYCGAIEIDWEVFASAMTYLHAVLNNFQTKIPFKDAFQSARNIIDVRQHYGDINEIQPSLIINKYQHFGIYMHKLSHQNCYDDRDRVYALYGLKPFYYDLVRNQDPEDNFFKLKVDYDKSAYLIYREWAIDLMSTGDMNFILDAGIWQRNIRLRYEGMAFVSNADGSGKSYWIKTEEDEAAPSSDNGSSTTVPQVTVGKEYKADDQIPVANAWIEPSLLDLPSWVPDLSRKSSSLPWTLLHGSRGFQARSKQPTLQFVKWQSGEDETPKKIWVKAVPFGRIGSRVAIHKWDDTEHGSHFTHIKETTVMIEAVFKRFASSEDTPWPIEEDMKSSLARTVFADGSGTTCQAYLRTNHQEASTLPDGSKLVANIQALQDMWQMYKASWEILTESHAKESTEEAPSEKRGAIFSAFASIHLCLSEALEGHNFFITDRKFIGLAPLAAKEGDMIILVDSVRTPMVVRSVKTSASEAGLLVVGPCYVHGVMYGETLPESGCPLAQEGTYVPLI